MGWIWYGFEANLGNNPFWQFGFYINFDPIIFEFEFLVGFTNVT